MLDNIGRIEGYLAGLDREAWRRTARRAMQSSAAWSGSAKRQSVSATVPQSCCPGSRGLTFAAWATGCVTPTTESALT